MGLPEHGQSEEARLLGQRKELIAEGRKVVAVFNSQAERLSQVSQLSRENGILRRKTTEASDWRTRLDQARDWRFDKAEMLLARLRLWLRGKTTIESCRTQPAPKLLQKMGITVLNHILIVPVVIFLPHREACSRKPELRCPTPLVSIIVLEI